MKDDNYFTLKGYVGSIRRSGKMVVVNICNKRTYFKQTNNSTVLDETWISCSFFGQVADKIEKVLLINDLIRVHGELYQWPKNDPSSRIRFNCNSFDVLNKYPKDRIKADITSKDVPDDFYIEEENEQT